MHVIPVGLRGLLASLLFLEILCLVGCTGVSGNTSAPAINAYDGPIAVNPANLNFGDVRVGTSRTLDVTLNNPSKESVSLSQKAVVGRGFTATGVGSGLTLEPGHSVVLTVRFLPAATGDSTGSVLVSTTMSTRPITILLAGNGVPASGHYVTLHWNPSSTHVAGYHVYRRGSGGKYGLLNPGLDHGTSYTDTSVKAGEKYFYAVTAVSASRKESKYSNEVSVTIPSP